MLTTLAFLVFFSAIIIFFAQEIRSTVKRVFEVRGAKLLLPLSLASWAIYHFDYWFLWAIYYYRECLQKALKFLINVMPFHQWATIEATVVLLTVISVVPVFLLDLIWRRKAWKGYEYSYLTSTLIWIISSFLLIVVR